MTWYQGSKTLEIYVLWGISRHLLRPWLYIMWRIFYTCLQNITEKVKTNHSVDTKVLGKIFHLAWAAGSKKILCKNHLLDFEEQIKSKSGKKLIKKLIFEFNEEYKKIRNELKRNFINTKRKNTLIGASTTVARAMVFTRNGWITILPAP